MFFVLLSDQEPDKVLVVQLPIGQASEGQIIGETHYSADWCHFVEVNISCLCYPHLWQA